jgi:hypothetical protein
MNGFETVEITGSGIFSAFFLNWYFILMNKLKITSRVILQPARQLRLLCYRVEIFFKRFICTDRFPSFYISAKAMKK